MLFGKNSKENQVKSSSAARKGVAVGRRPGFRAGVIEDWREGGAGKKINVTPRSKGVRDGR
ncbi:MAG TPA: hypothetical protein VHQ64_17555 [Pyrinomonadaceae bacterium]|jgi:hypothetical protein|nr:hypothetical protein [Pyrinomonadaceae bacterium]